MSILACVLRMLSLGEAEEIAAHETAAIDRASCTTVTRLCENLAPMRDAGMVQRDVMAGVVCTSGKERPGFISGDWSM